jgi:hypothetical protein
MQLLIGRPREPFRVQQPIKGPQLCVDTHAVSLAIPVDVLPLPLANWMDHYPVLSVLRRWSQERVLQPAKIELVTSYKNESKYNYNSTNL